MIIELKNISKNFGENSVHKNCNLAVKEGSFVSLIGPSGVGKSVLLKYILGFMAPDQGEVLVNGWQVNIADTVGLTNMRSNFGVVFQGSALLDSLTTFQNVALPLVERTSLTNKEIKEKVLAALDQLGLHDSQDKFPSQISGGMKRRVALARSLMLEPRILLFDEPTTGLDPATSHSIYKLFRKSIELYNCTALMITHDIPNIFHYVDEVAILANQEITQHYNQQTIYNSKSQWLQDSIQSKEIKI